MPIKRQHWHHYQQHLHPPLRAQLRPSPAAFPWGLLHFSDSAYNRRPWLGRAANKQPGERRASQPRRRGKNDASMVFFSGFFTGGGGSFGKSATSAKRVKNGDFFFLYQMFYMWQKSAIFCNKKCNILQVVVFNSAKNELMWQKIVQSYCTYIALLLQFASCCIIMIWRAFSSFFRFDCRCCTFPATPRHI